MSDLPENQTPAPPPAAPPPADPPPSRRSPAALIVLLTVVVLGALLLWQPWGSREPVDPHATEGPTPHQVEQIDAAERFWETLDEHAPTFGSAARECPVDGTELDAPIREQDNRFGGVATDLMKIALTPPGRQPAPPVLDRQDFDLLLVTCPTCLATYYNADLTNIARNMPPGGADKLKTWESAEVVPSLAQRGDALTYDEQHLLRYLTSAHAGFPDHELGYTALPGAYSTNVSVYLGRDYSLPAAAFYALAAAHFQRWIDGGEYENKSAGSTVAMILGELYRLLGRAEQAQAAFDKARELEGLDERTLRVVDHLEELLQSGDYELARAPIEGFEAPPVGWYLDQMLPAINGELAVTRERWAALETPEAVLAELRAELEQ